MSLSSVYFSQVGENKYQAGEFVRTFFKPEKINDQFLVSYQEINGDLGIYVSKEQINSVTGTKDFWTLPKDCDNESYNASDICSLPKFPTAGTAIYTHSYRITTCQKPVDANWIPVQEIMERFNKGLPIGIELVNAALKILNIKDEKLSLPNVAATDSSLGFRYAAIAEKIITKNELKLWEQLTQSNFALEFQDTENPANPFIGLGTRQDQDGNTITFAKRRGNDSEDSICFCWHAGRIYMAIRLGVRAALSQWEIGRSLISIEGVAGSLEPDDLSEEKILQRAIEETKEEIGIYPVNGAIKAGSFYTASEVTPEKSTSVIVEIDPSKTCVAHHAADEIQDTRFIELDELITACDEGTVIDERLEVSARLLKAIHGYHDPLKLPVKLNQTIGFFGGTFDVFHEGHINTVRQSLKMEDLDGLVIVPSKQNPFKLTKPMLSNEDRQDSVIAVASQVPHAFVSLHELNSDKPYVSTLDSIRELKKIIPKDSNILMVIGTDILDSLHRWEGITELIQQLDGLVISLRDGFDATKLSSYQSLYSSELWDFVKKAKVIPQGSGASSSGIKLLLNEPQANIETMMPAKTWKYLKKYI